jgi:hypothetical protein
MVFSLYRGFEAHTSLQEFTAKAARKQTEFNMKCQSQLNPGRTPHNPPHAQREAA